MFVVVGKHRKETGALGEEEEDSNHSRFRPSGGWEVGTETRASAVGEGDVDGESLRDEDSHDCNPSDSHSNHVPVSHCSLPCHMTHSLPAAADNRTLGVRRFLLYPRARAWNQVQRRKGEHSSQIQSRNHNPLF